MSKFDKLYEAINSGKTLLGVGPMSWNCIDATIEIANENNIPMSIICSRRQVECEEMGGGYVTDTKTLAEYVRKKDKKLLIYLNRDHGGPLQGSTNGEYEDEMVNSIESYFCDIMNGFDILHLDPSLRGGSLEETILDIKFLYNQCEVAAAIFRKHIIYEAGTEEHSEQSANMENFNHFLNESQKYPKIKFVVGNMGNWVKETENVGKFDEKKAKELLKICNSKGFYLKGHNTDYVGKEVLNKHPQLGIHSANIAPEYGVTETEELLFLLEFHRMDKLRRKFIEVAVNSGKWKKWMKSSEDPGEPSPDLHKAKICGHYVFSDPQVLEIKEKLRKKCPELDNMLKGAVKRVILEHLGALGWEIKSGLAKKR